MIAYLATGLPLDLATGCRIEVGATNELPVLSQPQG
jgi:hypothetical protein